MIIDQQMQAEGRDDIIIRLYPSFPLLCYSAPLLADRHNSLIAISHDFSCKIQII